MGACHPSLLTKMEDHIRNERTVEGVTYGLITDGQQNFWRTIQFPKDDRIFDRRQNFRRMIKFPMDDKISDGRLNFRRTTKLPTDDTLHEYLLPSPIIIKRKVVYALVFSKLNFTWKTERGEMKMFVRQTGLLINFNCFSARLWSGT